MTLDVLMVYGCFALSDYQQDIGKNQILDDYNQSEMFLAPRDSVELNRTDGNLVDSLNESILHGDNFVNESATNSMDMYHNIYNEQSKIDETNENMGSLRNAQYSNYGISLFIV
ncbi:hypothetical protein GJ496_001855 [Pomphorhynchus laevis]|nr:hypothetical protein GJ496_001855 [Pomphorhynchus laevis]